jgi:2-oxoglutarate ferredoxin oxidoreductase subunit beta
MVYIVENNGVYGLTKGQFSATTDKGSKPSAARSSNDEPIDMVMLALQLGASFVARSFSGDKGKLVPLIRAAASLAPWRGFHRRHQPLRRVQQPRLDQELRFRAQAQRSGQPPRLHAREDGVTTEYARDLAGKWCNGDGSVLHLRKLHEDYDASDKAGAMNYLLQRQAAGEIVTGLLYLRPDADDDRLLNTVGARSINLVRRNWSPAPQRWRVQRIAALRRKRANKFAPTTTGIFVGGRIRSAAVPRFTSRCR